jgi:ubiquinone biosynthesis protein COQ9
MPRPPLQPSTLRSLLPKRPTPTPATRTYYSYETPLPPPYPKTETAILSASLLQVPIHGWTSLSLRNGARSAGYLDATTNLFPNAEFELVLYHLRTQRLGLKDKVVFADEAQLGTTDKVKRLVMERLRGNGEVGVQGVRWQEVSFLFFFFFSVFLFVSKQQQHYCLWNDEKNKKQKKIHD